MKTAEMNRVRFDLKLLFVVVTNVCVIAWGVAALYRQSFLFLVTPAITALSAALCGKRNTRRAMLLGAIGGAIGAAAMPLTMCAFIDFGYFFHEGPGEYFEDGALAEVVVYPIVYIFTWGPAGAVLGLLIGAFVGVFTGR